MRHASSRRGLCVVAGAALLLLPLLVVPRLTHTGWNTIAHEISKLTPLELALLAGVWLAGLYAHTFVSTGALPGLTHRRAMALNFSGSAVSHLAPFGGVLGAAVNYTMLRSWQFDSGDFIVLVLLTNACGIAIKIFLPALALLLTFGLHPHGALIPLVLLGLVAFGAIISAATRVVRTRSDAPGRVTRTIVSVVSRFLGHAHGEAVDEARDRIHRDLRAALTRSWRRMTFGTLGYAALQATLLWLCLHTMGAHLSPVDTFAAYAVGSALTLIPFTPGGVGFSEAGTAGALYGLGAKPGVVAAAVLLYTTFTRWMEIPAGATTTTWWWLRDARNPPIARPHTEPADAREVVDVAS